MWMTVSFPECKASIDDKPAQWNKFLYHKWGTFRLCLKVSQCGKPLDSHVE